MSIDNLMMFLVR